MTFVPFENFYKRLSVFYVVCYFVPILFDRYELNFSLLDKVFENNVKHHKLQNIDKS